MEPAVPCRRPRRTRTLFRVAMPVGGTEWSAMIVIMQTGAGLAATDEVVRRIEAAGLGAHVFRGAERNVIAVLGTGDPSLRSGQAPTNTEQALAALQEVLVGLNGVERVEGTVRRFQLASRDVLPGGTTFPIGSAQLGADLLTIVGASRPRPAGELVALARAAKEAGADVFWAGRGDSGELRRDLIGALDDVRDSVGLPVLVDVWDPGEVDRLSRHADALQIPAQQMQDVPLIRAAGEGDRPVVVGRGQSATIEEWLMAAERALREGNRQVALGEQGIRTFETAVPAVLDFNAIALAHRLSHLPVVVNPSLAAGESELVPDLALAAAALKADAIVLDVHAGAADDPSAGRQALPIDSLAGLIARLKQTRAAVGR